MEKSKATLMEMIAGILVYTIIAQVVVLILPGDRLYNSCGLWIGGILAGGILIHMKRSIEDALDYGTEGASGHMRKMYAIRMIVVGMVIALVLHFQVGSILTVLVGLIGIKVSAYTQPYMHRILSRFENNK